MTARGDPPQRQSRMRNQMRRLANTIVRKMNQRGLSEIAANISTFSRTASGTSWSDALALTMTTKAANNMPAFDIASAIAANEANEMGYTYDTLDREPDGGAERCARSTAGELSNVLRDLRDHDG
jgi:hypothetical protein